MEWIIGEYETKHLGVWLSFSVCESLSLSFRPSVERSAKPRIMNKVVARGEIKFLKVKQNNSYSKREAGRPVGWSVHSRRASSAPSSRRHSHAELDDGREGREEKEPAGWMADRRTYRPMGSFTAL